MNSIQKRWEEYRSTMPGNVSLDQIIEARLGFFAGAASIYFMMRGKAMDQDVTQQEGEEFLESLGDEIDQFMKNMRTGIDILVKDFENAR